MLNIGSLLAGLFAWLFAIVAITTRKVSVSYKNTVISFSLCAAALVLQFFEINRRVLRNDYAAIEDTIRAVLLASVILAGTTIMLNIFAFIKRKNTSD